MESDDIRLRRIEGEEAERVHDLANKLWYKLVNTPGGHPGPAGSPGDTDTPWSLTRAYLEGAQAALQQVLDRLEPKKPFGERELAPEERKKLREVFVAPDTPFKRLGEGTYVKDCYWAVYACHDKFFLVLNDKDPWYEVTEERARDYL